MNKLVKILLKAGGIAIAVGAILLIAGVLTGSKNGISIGSDFRVDINEENNFTFEKLDFTGVESVEADTDNAKIAVVLTDNGKYGISANLKNVSGDPEIGVDNGVLRFEPSGKGVFNILAWDLGSLFNAEDNIVTIYVPRNADLKNLKLHTSNGAISIDGITADEITADTSNGSILAKDVKVLNKSVFTSSNGKIELYGTFNDSTYAKTSNGKVTGDGAFKGDTVFKSSNGSIEFTTSVKRNECEIKADTSNGTVRIDGNKVTDEYHENTGASNSADLKTSNGSITVEFR